MDHSDDIKSSTLHVEDAPPGDAALPPARIPLWPALRKWPKVAAYCLALTSAILLWGYDMAMTGNLASLDQFKEDYGEFYDDEWIIPSRWLGAWNAASPIGIMIGSMLGGLIQDRWGRRISFGLGSVTSALGVAVVWCSQYASGEGRQGMFMLGKFTQGATIGIVMCTAQTYMSEVLPSTLRGPVIAFFPIFFLFGQLISAVIVFTAEDYVGPYAYQICIITEWPFSALPIIMAFIMPESPVYLVRKGKLDDAYKSQRRLHTADVDIMTSIERLQATILHEQEAAKSDKSKYIDCFKGTDLRRTMIVIFAAILPQLFGLPILGDGPYFSQIAGLDPDDSLIFLISGIVGGLVGNIVSMYLLTVIGRRRLVLTTLVPLILLWLGMGIAGCFDSQAVAWYVGVTLNLVTVIAALGIWPASYVVGGEVSSLRLRAKSQGLGWAFGGIANCAFSTVTPFIYNADAGNLRSKIGFVWFGICVLTLVGVWYLVPEMLGRTPLQLDLMFEQKVAASKFEKWRGDESGFVDIEVK